MIFIVNNLKYDTDKMELVSEKCEYSYPGTGMFSSLHYRARNVKIYVSKKRNWLLTFEKDYGSYAKSLTKSEAAAILIRYDYEAYEKIFGEIEEA